MLDKWLIMKMKLTEAQLRDIVRQTIAESLSEFKNPFKTLARGFKFENPFKTLARGFKIDDAEPTTYKEVFARCGYEVRDERQDNGGTLVYTVRKLGGAGEFYGDEPNEVVEALKRHGIRSKFIGNHKDAQYYFVFKIM